MKNISSPQNTAFKDALKLHTSRGRKQQQRIIIFGDREVRRVQNRKRIELDRIFVRNSQFETDTELRTFLNRTGDCETLLLDDPLFEKLCYGDRGGGLIATAKRPDIGPSDESLSRIKISDGGILLVLESLETPGNLGAVIRSADGAGVDAVIIADPETDPFHPNAIRNSMGTVFSVPLAITSSADAIRFLKQKQIATFSAVVDAESTIYESDLSGTVAIALGNESRGLSSIWKGNESLNRIKLPMLGSADSLNVSATASIMVYEARRQKESRRQK